MDIVIAGASGFLGSQLVPFLQGLGHTVRCLVRETRAGCIYWNPRTRQIDASHLEGADAVINLCGESILGRWTQEKMEAIRESRFLTTEFLTDTLLRMKNPPKRFLCASAIGYYGDRGEEILNERSLSGHGYLAEVCRHWEEICEKLTLKDIRVANMRFGLVLHPTGGALKRMMRPFRLGFGGVIGSGEQYVSWIAMEDVLQGILFLLEHPSVTGAVNFVSPTPVTNRKFTKTLASVYKKPTLMPLSAWILHLLFGSGADVYLSSLRVVPKRLSDEGYAFTSADLESTLKKYLIHNTDKR